MLYPGGPGHLSVCAPPALDDWHALALLALATPESLLPPHIYDSVTNTFLTEGDPKRRGLYFLFYSYAGLSGGAVLTALVAGGLVIGLRCNG